MNLSQLQQRERSTQDNSPTNPFDLNTSFKSENIPNNSDLSKETNLGYQAGSDRDILLNMDKNKLDSSKRNRYGIDLDKFNSNDESEHRLNYKHDDPEYQN